MNGNERSKIVVTFILPKKEQGVFKDLLPLIQYLSLREEDESFVADLSPLWWREAWVLCLSRCSCSLCSASARHEKDCS